jgi:hypothetical protein
MATLSWAVKCFRVFLDMGKPPLEIVAYSSTPSFPFQLRQNMIFFYVFARVQSQKAAIATQTQDFIRKDVAATTIEVRRSVSNEPVRSL